MLKMNHKHEFDLLNGKPLLAKLVGFQDHVTLINLDTVESLSKVDYMITELWTSWFI